MKASTDPPDARDPLDLAAWGFQLDAPGDGWLDGVRRALAPFAPSRAPRIGGYEILDEAARRGGQGVVFRARQPGTRRVVALKRLVDGSFASAASRARFAREVEAAASLDHPGIVRVFGVDEVDGQPLLAMEWIEGEPITDWTARHDREPRLVLELFLRVAEAVAHAHERGVLHRDLKPSNVLVDAGGEPHVLDFGLAKRLEDVDGASLTAGSALLGTPAYASPEQLRLVPGPIDERSDVWALGVLLYEMLTGASPWGRREGLSELLRTIERGAPPRPSALAPRLGRSLDGVVLRALSLRPHERTSSVADLAADVRRVLAGRRALATAPGFWTQLARLGARHRVASASLAALALALVAFGAHARWQARQVERSNDDLRRALGEAREARAQAELDAQRAAALLRFVPDCTHASADRRWAGLPFKPSTSDGTLATAPMSTPAASRFVGPGDVAPDGTSP